MGKSYRRKGRYELIKALFYLALAAIIIIGGSTWAIIKYNHKEYYTVIVTDKQIKRKSKESDVYMIFTEDKNGSVHVFENVDSLLAFKWNSSDMYGEIKKGHTYEFKTIGYRSGFWSMYPNIIEYKEVK